jgi:sporulation protein YlmC with PRC-barrel domain
MDIPVHAEVWCTDGLCGRSDELIIDPATEQVTHLIVKEEQGPYLERLVPVEKVADTSPGRVNLNCSASELERMEHFVDRQFVPIWTAGAFTMPAEPNIMVVSQERVPQGEIAIHKGAHVEAADGHVGRVDGLLVDPASEHITHLVLREGHLWGQKDVTIPVSEIARIEADRIYLKLDKHAVGDLPTVPIHRRHQAAD